MKENLAIGFYYGEDGCPFTASIGVDLKNRDAKDIAAKLSAHNDNGIPDEILLIINDTKKGPIVEEHWNAGREYDRDEDGEEDES